MAVLSDSLSILTIDEVDLRSFILTFNWHSSQDDTTYFNLLAGKGLKPEQLCPSEHRLWMKESHPRTSPKRFRSHTSQQSIYIPKIGYMFKNRAPTSWDRSKTYRIPSYACKIHSFVASGVLGGPHPLVATHGIHIQLCLPAQLLLCSLCSSPDRH